MTTEGIIAAKVTIPAALAAPVSFSASAARATISAHADDCENAVAAHSRLNSACCRAPSILEVKVSFLTFYGAS